MSFYPCVWLLLVLLLKWTYLILPFCLVWNQRPLSFALAFTWFFHKHLWIIMSSECPISLVFKALSHSLIDDVKNFPIQFYLFNIFCKYTNSNMTLDYTEPIIVFKFPHLSFSFILIWSYFPKVFPSFCLIELLSFPTT